MGTRVFNFYDNFFLREANGQFNFFADTIKAYLSNTSPSASSHATLSQITEIATGGGYVQGTGLSVSVSGSLVSNGYNLTGSGTISIVATGNVPPFRYIILGDSSTTGTPLIGWFDRGATLNLTEDDSYTISIDGIVLYRKQRAA